MSSLEEYRLRDENLTSPEGTLLAQSGRSWTATEGLLWQVDATHLQHDEFKLLKLLSAKRFPKP